MTEPFPGALLEPGPTRRPVKRAVQRELETTLAKALLRGDFVDEDTIVVDADDEGLIMTRGASSGNGTAAAALPAAVTA